MIEMRNVRNTTKRALSVILAIMMALSCFSAAFSVIASAADDWTYVEGTAYEPVTIYKNVSGDMVNGKTYRLGVYYYNTVLTVSASGAVSLSAADTPKRTQPELYTSNDGSDVLFQTTDYYTENDSGSDFVWQNGTLKNPDTGKYLVNSGTTALATNASSVTWTFSNNHLYRTVSSRTRYVRNSNNTVVLGTSNSNNYIYLYEKTTAYKKTSSGEGGYYKYNGPTEYTIDVGDSFNESVVLNNISVLYKTDKNTADAQAEKLTINNEAITFSWNKPVDTSKEGVYTGTVYADGKAIQTISVYVESGVDAGIGKADPSTSKIEDRFSLSHADDGKIETDKTVQFGSDEFGAFNNYDDNEFSVALSALSQSYQVVETEETEKFEKTHADVVFIIDASGSMRTYNVADGTVTRAQATAEALNDAIKELYAADPETRIGIVTFGNDYHSEGIYLPLDKYTLPEGQTEYITWNGRMVAQEGTPDVTSFATALCSGTGNRYFYPTTSSTSTTNIRSNFRYYINTNGAVTRYNANSYTAGTNLGTVADGKYINDTTNGYTIYRKGNTFYVYKTDVFNSALAQANSVKTYNDAAYAVKTTSAERTLTLNRIDTWAGYDNGVFNKPAFSEMNKIATTADGVTYYAYTWYDQVITLYSDEYEWPIARMEATPESASFTNVFYNEYITIKATSGTTISYSTNTYADKTGVSVSFEPCEYLAATNFLINSNGDVVAPSQYQFVGNIGTYTQSGLQAAENMFTAASDKENRVPAVVLISDGIPTVANTNVNNPDLKFSVANGTTVVGTGMTTVAGTSPDLANYGLYTIETAMKVKKNVNNMYNTSKTRNALFYTIGPGVKYQFGITVLEPNDENVAAAAKINSPGTDDPNASESGVAVPSDLAKVISAKYSNLDYVDYADWAFLGDMSSDELKDAFRRVVSSIIEVDRPLKSLQTESSTEGKVSMVFTDVIGYGMKLSSDPVVNYGGKNYTPTSSSTENLSDGTKVTTYGYDYRVTEESTNTIYSLSGLDVKVIEDKDGKQTVKWGIPSELVPIITHDTFKDTYTKASPIRLIYKVNLDETKVEESGKYYTNSTAEPANVEYTPSVGNPYYYNNELGSDGKMHSTLKNDINKYTRKTENVTETNPDSNDRTVDQNGNVTSELGNNGVVEITVTTINITKVWNDGKNAAGQRPDSITVQLYRNGRVYGDAKTVSTQNSKVGTTADGNETWTVAYKGLPYSADFVYSISEVSVDGYTTEMKKDGNNFTITNSVEKIKLSYDLYLVDRDGNPIDDNGQSVSFEDRVVKSELVTIDQYVNTTETIDLDEIEKLLPEGYIVYNPDTSYTQTFNGKDSGTNSASVKDEKTGTTKVVYPETAVINSDGSVTGLTDYDNTHVTFAIVKVEILPDVIVIDYGKTVLCSPLDNDSGAISLAGLGALDSDKYGNEFTSQNGVFRTEGDNVTFSPFSYMSSINRVKYFANVRNSNNGVQVLSSTISVIPATTVYYEDDFGGSAENGGLYIQYTGDWAQVDGNGNTTAISANTDTTDRQDRGEVGEGNVPYGYDSSYKDCVQFSNGTATVVNGTVSKGADGKPQFDATAEFTFTGTGFDLISRTDLDCGMITVTVYHTDGSAVANVPVINKGIENLYQIPVISFTNLPYDTYVVKINVNAPAKLLNITGSRFYLDAIRIYNPMGLDSDDNAEFDEANDAYYADKEANAYVASIRDYILAIEDLGVDEASGAVYVDTIDNDYSDGAVLDKNSINDIRITGPNEEVYLTPGKGIGFALCCSAIPETVQLEIKIPAPLNNSANIFVQTLGGSKTITKEVNSASEMFYDITDAVQFTRVTKDSGRYYRAVVVLSNGLEGASANDIISITNIKMTYPSSVKNIVESKNGDQIIAGNTDIVTASAGSMELSEDGTILETAAAPEEVRVGVMASWNIYCDVFDTVYTQHQATIPTYNVKALSNFETVDQGKATSATFATSQYVSSLQVYDENGKYVNAKFTSELDEDKLYGSDFENAKTWTVTVDNTVEGDHTYTVVATDGEGESANASLKVLPNKVVSLKVVKAPAKTNYTYGEKLDISGLVLEAKYSDGSVKKVTSGYTLSTYTADHSGKKTVKIYFEGAEAGFQINVKMTFGQVIATIFGFGWLWKK